MYGSKLFALVLVRLFLYKCLPYLKIKNAFDCVFIVPITKRLYEGSLKILDKIFRNVCYMVIINNEKLLKYISINSFVKSIIDDTLNLIDINKNKFGYYITPLHYIALLDTDANWFTKWMVK